MEFKVPSTAAQGRLWTETETERSGETKRRERGEGGGEREMS